MIREFALHSVGGEKSLHAVSVEVLSGANDCGDGFSTLLSPDDRFTLKVSIVCANHSKLVNWFVLWHGMANISFVLY